MRDIFWSFLQVELKCMIRAYHELVQITEWTPSRRVKISPGDANSWGVRQHTIWPIFPKKMHEMKKVWSRGGRLPRTR